MALGRMWAAGSEADEPASGPMRVSSGPEGGWGVAEGAGASFPAPSRRHFPCPSWTGLAVRISIRAYRRAVDGCLPCPAIGTARGAVFPSPVLRGVVPGLKAGLLAGGRIPAQAGLEDFWRRDIA